jgi:hypothetical protein
MRLMLKDQVNKSTRAHKCWLARLENAPFLPRKDLEILDWHKLILIKIKMITKIAKKLQLE